MTTRAPRAGKRPTAPRVGVFGKVGAGNIGNDASMEAILGFLGTYCPEAAISAMCTGPETLRTRYGIDDAVPLFWHNKFNATGATSGMLKVVGRFLDTFRTAAWVGRQDAVIVPGAGVLEASLPMVPRGWPYALFLLAAYGKILRTKVALVSVGAGAVKKPTTRWLMNSAARLAYYRSYRDPGAREAMRKRGLDVSSDEVYPDLAFSLAPPPVVPIDEQLVAVGVMDYRGSNDERKLAEEIYARYAAAMKSFVRWLAEGGHKALLLVGDTNGSDGAVVDDIIADVRETLPDLDPSTVTAAGVSSYSDVMKVLGPVNCVVAIRYHNVLCSLKLSKPTISIGYSPKHDDLLADMGLADFIQDVRTLDVDELKKRFSELEKRSAELQQIVAERNAAKAELLEAQFKKLSTSLFPHSGCSSPDTQSGRLSKLLRGDGTA
jgi:polysaccharide pyruvyl transferase WcaK-like protein